MAKKKSPLVVERNVATNVATVERPHSLAPKYEREVGAFDLVLGIRRIRSGPFSGLWELTELTVPPESKIKKLIVDATTKEFVVRKAWEAVRRTI